MKKVILLIASIAAFSVMSHGQLVIENFDGMSQGYLEITTASGYTGLTNSATLTGLSGSTYCGYGRKNGNQYDYVGYTLTSTSMFTGTTVSALRNGTMKFKLNIATQAAAGIKVKIKLQNTSLSGAPNYLGNSEYDATTTIGGSSNPFGWETLTFSLNTVTGTMNNTITPVNQFIIFFDYLGGGNEQFFFDNFQVFDPTVTVTAFLGDNSVEDLKSSIFPNPSTGFTSIEYNDNATDLKVTLNDMVGKEMKEIENLSGSATFKGQVDVSSLEPGIYYVNFQANGTSRRLKKLVVVR